MPLVQGSDEWICRSNVKTVKVISRDSSREFGDPKGSSGRNMWGKHMFCAFESLPCLPRFWSMWGRRKIWACASHRQWLFNNTLSRSSGRTPTHERLQMGGRKTKSTCPYCQHWRPLPGKLTLHMSFCFLYKINILYSPASSSMLFFTKLLYEHYYFNPWFL